MISELPAILTLSHFCEQHGPSVLFTTQSFCMNSPASTCDYTFPQSFDRFKKKIPNLKRQLKETADIHFCFESNSFEDSSPILHSTISSISLDEEGDRSCSNLFGSQTEYTTKRKVHFAQTTFYGDSKSSLEVNKSSLIEENSSGPTKYSSQVFEEKEEILDLLTVPPQTGDEAMNTVIQESPFSSRKNSSESDLATLEEVLSASPSPPSSASGNSATDIALFSISSDNSVSAKPNTFGLKPTFRKRSQSLIVSSGINILMKKNVSGKCPSIHVTVRETQKYDPTTSPPANCEKCPSCSSVISGSGFFSPDDETHSNFISTKLPSAKNYGIIRSACVRSLSCEIYPGKDGSVVFNNIGDDKNNWAVLSYMFKIKDTKSRGGARRYSFVLVTEFQILVSIVDHITAAFQSLANQMQQRSELLFERELKNTKISPNVHNHPYSFYGGNELRLLTELMCEKNFFPNLHYQFSSILKQIKLILSEKSYLYQSSTLKGSSLPRQFSFPCITSFKELKNAVGTNVLQTLLFNVIVGNQTIIRGEYSLVDSIIFLLKRLIPNGCCKIIEYSEVYKESWECNLLGLHPDVPLPLHLSEGSFALIDICKYPTTNSKKIEFKFSVTGSHSRPTHLGSEIEKILLASLPESIESLRLKNIKTSWKNKAKLLNTLQFCLHLDSENDPKVKLFQKTLNLNKDDFSILRFWAAGQKRNFLNNYKIFKSH